MKTLYKFGHLRKGVYLFFAMIIGLLASCGDNLINIYRDNLTLQEAQKLVSFQICVPGYIPPGIDPNPNIINQAEGPDPDLIPEENYIRLQYKRISDQEKAFEVFQRFTNLSDEEFSVYSQNIIEDIEGSKIELLYWIAGRFSKSEIDSAIEKIKMEDDILQTNQVVWMFFEIVDPEQYRSTMTYWVNNHVEYRILSHLSAKEIKAITESMINCSVP